MVAAVSGLLVALLSSRASRGEELSDEPAQPAVRVAKRPRVRYTDGRLPASDPPPQPGGFQAWGDERFFHDWRIQRNAISGHCRLMDGAGKRHAWGTFDECLARLEAIRIERRLPPMQGKAVVVLHGLDGSPETMRPLAAYLRAGGTMHVLSFGYASRRGTIDDYARSLGNVVDHLDQVEEVSMVAFGLGNVVVRRWLADRRGAEGGEAAGPRLNRLVMLAPPNQTTGSATDDMEMLVSVLGLSAAELDGGWAALGSRLAVPTCEFGIIAGGRGDDRGLSTRLPGDDDGMLSLAATRLAGAREFLVLPVEHARLGTDPRVHACTLNFLRNGSFDKPQKHSH
ncbi:MAG TPA: hypothetical protein VJ783_15060 [Pirellulales bacterium]|nr:hypothetical protein [Pirellulales bacterium]